MGCGDLVRPEERRRVYWTKVSANTLVLTGVLAGEARNGQDGAGSGAFLHRLSPAETIPRSNKRDNRASCLGCELREKWKGNENFARE